MKILFLLFLLVGFSVSAQMNTNTDSSGYVTNTALLFPFTLTNSSGVTITNAILFKLTANKFVYKTPDGGMGMMRLESLSKDLREKFGYNESDARNADLIENEKKAQLDSFYEQQKELLAEKRIRDDAIKRMMSYSHTVEGSVIQKIDEGMLIDDKSYGVTILLKDFPQAKIIDGIAAEDTVRASAYPEGIYSYKTVNGSENTVHVFTCSTNVALEYFLEHPEIK